VIVDTHIHLDNDAYNEDLNTILQKAREGGVKRFIIPGADPATLHKAISIAQENDDVYFAVGIHPYDIESFEGFDFSQYIKHPKCIAIGECGLDYFRLEGSDEEKQKEKEKQKEVFITQIELAKQYGKPLIVHIREASNDAKELLVKYNAGDVGGVLHCFNADEQLLSLANQGFYFGIGGVLTFKNAKKLVNVLPKIPKEKLLIETDGPYLTPTPHRGTRNEPLYTTLIAQKMAELLKEEYKTIVELTTKNSQILFNIK